MADATRLECTVCGKKVAALANLRERRIRRHRIAGVDCTHCPGRHGYLPSDIEQTTTAPAAHTQGAKP